MNTLRLGLVGAVLVALGLAGHATPAHAATTVSGCPMTRALLEADIAAAGDVGTVAFDCTYPVTINFNNETVQNLHNYSGIVLWSGSVTLDASGAKGSVTLDGENYTRLFVVTPGSSLSLHHLTVQGGKGSAIGVQDHGTLAVTDSTVWGTGYGTAISSSGTVSITRSTLYNNFSGAIANYAGGTLNITDSTLYNNWAAGRGGALYNAGTRWRAHARDYRGWCARHAHYNGANHAPYWAGMKGKVNS